MNFEPKQKDVRVPYNSLRDDAGDVRDFLDMTAADEMAKRGKIANTVVTQDFVYLDGRTGALAQTIAAGKLGDKNAMVIVDILSFRYDSLNDAQKAEFLGEALERNYGARGFRVLATESDCIKTVEAMIRLDRTKPQIAPLVSYMGSRFSRIYDLAKNRVVQSKIAEARAMMANDSNMTAAQAAKRVGLASAEGIVSTSRIHETKAFNALKKKQAAIVKAVTAVSRYAEARMTMLRGGLASGKTIDALLSHDAKTVNRLVANNTAAAVRVQKELVNYIPGYHHSK